MEFTPPDAPVEDLAEFARWAHKHGPRKLASVIPELSTCSSARVMEIADLFATEGYPWTAIRVRETWRRA